MLITILVQGGLANQIFQYRAVYTIVKKHNLDNINIICDISTLGRHSTPRKFELSKYNIDTTIGYNMFAPKFTEQQFNYTNKLEKFILEHYNNKTPQITIQGYFISYKYLPKFENEYVRENIAIMHIRLKDYLRPDVADYHGILSRGYYQQAITKIPSDLQIYAVSDDNEEAYALILKYLDRKVEIISPESPIDRMSKASHLIIANSSYSLYAAYRNHKADMIISPSRFFKASMPEQDLLKPEWIKIPVFY